MIIGLVYSDGGHHRFLLFIDVQHFLVFAVFGSCAVTNKIKSTISHDRTWRGSKVRSDLIVNIRVFLT